MTNRKASTQHTQRQTEPLNIRLCICQKSKHLVIVALGQKTTNITYMICIRVYHIIKIFGSKRKRGRKICFKNSLASIEIGNPGYQSLFWMFQSQIWFHLTKKKIVIIYQLFVKRTARFLLHLRSRCSTNFGLQSLSFFFIKGSVHHNLFLSNGMLRTQDLRDFKRVSSNTTYAKG